MGNCWVLSKDWHGPISVLKANPNYCIRKETWWARQKRWGDQDQEATVVSQVDKMPAWFIHGLTVNLV